MINRKSDGLDRSYILLCFFFVFYFYVIPLIIIADKSIGHYAGLTFTINDSELYFSLIALLIFVGGFFVLDIFHRRKTQSNPTGFGHVGELRNERLFWVLALTLLIFFINNIFFSDYGKFISEARQGAVVRSRFEYIIFNVIFLLKFVVFFTLVQIKRRKLAILFIAVGMLSDLSTSVGRANAILNLILLIIVLFNFNARVFIRLFIFFSFLFIPFSINLKHLIGLVSTDGDWLSYLAGAFIDIDVDVYISNFGHPLLAMLKVERILEVSGFSYFSDYLQGFLPFLKIFGIDFGYTITHYSTYAFTGAFESVIPPSHIAFGYLQLGYFGVFISGIFYRVMGIFAKILIARTAADNNPLIFMILFLAANTFYHGDIKIILAAFVLPSASIILLIRFFVRKT